MASSSGLSLTEAVRRSPGLIRPDLRDLRIVLIGKNESENSRVENIIKSREASSHLQRNIRVISSSLLLQPNVQQNDVHQEVYKCVSQSAPGPHVIILVLQYHDFTDSDRHRVNYVLSLFSKQSIKHTIVLTTDEETHINTITSVWSSAINSFIQECGGEHLQFNTECHSELFRRIEQILKEEQEEFLICDLYEDRGYGTVENKKENHSGEVTTAGKSKLNIVLCGNNTTLKTSVSNMFRGTLDKTKSLLQRDRGKECVKTEVKIDGRQISVVELPALSRLSEEEVMQETLNCLSLCHPGANFFILATPVTPLNHEDKAEMEKINRIFFSKEHFMVLFITEHTVDQRVSDFVKSTESQRIVSLYGRQYSVMGIKDKRNSKLISELFSGLDNMKTEPYSLQMFLRAPERRVRHEVEQQLRAQTDEIKELQEKIKTLEGVKLNLVLCGNETLKSSISELILNQRQKGSVISSEYGRKNVEFLGCRFSLLELPALSRLSEEEVMRHTLRCVSLCQPGVHVFIIVIPHAALNNEDKAEMETIKRIFSSRINKHIMILIKQNSENQAEELDEETQSVIKSLGGRHHFIGPNTPVSSLMENIKKMVEDNEEEFFSTETLLEPQMEKLKEFEEKRRIQSLETWFQSQGSAEREDEVRIVLLGKTGVGKSATGNTILEREVFISRSSHMSVTEVCQKHTAEINGRNITVIDTPGLFDTKLTNEEIKREIGHCISMILPGPHVFLLVIPLGRFTKEEQESVKIIQEAFGENSVTFTMVLFTRGDDLEGQTIEQWLGKADTALKNLLKECGNRVHVFNNKTGDQTQVSDLLQKIDDMVKANGGSYYSCKMFREMERKIQEQQKQILMDRLEQLKREKEELMKKHEEEKQRMKKMMEEERQKHDKERERREEEFREREERYKRDIKEREEQERKTREEMKREREEWEKQRQQEKQRREEEDEDRRQKEQAMQEEHKQEKESMKMKMEEEQQKHDKERKRREEEFREREERFKRDIKEREEQERKTQEEIKREREEMKREREEWEKQRQQEKQRREEEDEYRRQKEQEMQEEHKQEKERMKKMMEEERQNHDKERKRREEEWERADERRRKIEEETWDEYYQKLKREKERRLREKEELQFKHESERERMKRMMEEERQKRNKERRRREEETMEERHQRDIKHIEDQDRKIREEMKREREEREKQKQQERQRREEEEEFYLETSEVQLTKTDKGASPDSGCLRVLLFGRKGRGKSATGNTILRKNEFYTEDSSRLVTTVCKKAVGEVNGRSVAVIDTPGLFDTTLTREQVQEQIMKCVSLSAPGPHVFIIVLRVGKISKHETDTLDEIMRIFGPQAAAFSIVLFTRAEKLKGQTIKQYVEKSKNAELNKLINDCGNRVLAINNKEMTDGGLFDMIDQVKESNQGPYFTNEMFEEAAISIERRKKIIEENKRGNQTKVEELKAKYKRESRNMRRRLKEKKQKTDEERERLKNKFREQVEKLEREFEEKETSEQEKREEEENQKQSELEKQLRDEHNERLKELEREIEDQKLQDEHQQEEREEEDRKREEEFKQEQEKLKDQHKRIIAELQMKQENEMKKRHSEEQEKKKQEEKKREEWKRKIEETESDKKEMIEEQLREWEEEKKRQTREREEEERKTKEKDEKQLREKQEELDKIMRERSDRETEERKMIEEETKKHREEREQKEREYKEKRNKMKRDYEQQERERKDEWERRKQENKERQEEKNKRWMNMIEDLKREQEEELKRRGREERERIEREEKHFDEMIQKYEEEIQKIKTKHEDEARKQEEELNDLKERVNKHIEEFKTNTNKIYEERLKNSKLCRMM